MKVTYPPARCSPCQGQRYRLQESHWMVPRGFNPGMLLRRAGGNGHTARCASSKSEWLCHKRH
jgi:hypothetical protein